MTNENVKLFNPQKFNVGVTTFTRPLGFNIAPGSFAIVSPDDVAYLNSISTLQSRGILRIENTMAAKEDVATQVMESIGIDPNDAQVFIDDEEIKTKLNMTAQKLSKWLDTVTEEYIKDRIYDVAVQMDNLPANKLKVLKAHMPEKSFIEEE